MNIIKLIMLSFLCIGTINAQNNEAIQPILNSYITLKDALVKTDGVASSSMAKNLKNAIEGIKISELNAEIKTIWSKMANELKEDADRISEAKEITQQRDFFMSLSKNMYSLIKVSKLNIPVYYQFCPMANKGKGANWLSLESNVKNPYYGNKMLTCGKVVDTIQ